jgi:hypothetical protein
MNDATTKIEGKDTIESTGSLEQAAGVIPYHLVGATPISSLKGSESSSSIDASASNHLPFLTRIEGLDTKSLASKEIDGKDGFLFAISSDPSTEGKIRLAEEFVSKAEKSGQSVQNIAEKALTGNSISPEDLTTLKTTCSEIQKNLGTASELLIGSKEGDMDGDGIPDALDKNVNQSTALVSKRLYKLLEFSNDEKFGKLFSPDFRKMLENVLNLFDKISKVASSPLGVSTDESAEIGDESDEKSKISSKDK